MYSFASSGEIGELLATGSPGLGTPVLQMDSSYSRDHCRRRAEIKGTPGCAQVLTLRCHLDFDAPKVISETNYKAQSI